MLLKTIKNYPVNSQLVPIYLFMLIISLNGCSAFNLDSNELINELIIRNDTDDTLHDVVLRVSGKNIILMTNYILPSRDYSLGFPELENEHNDATLEWTHNGVRYKREIKTNIPKDINKKVPAKVVIRIDDTGNIQSILEPGE